MTMEKVSSSPQVENIDPTFEPWEPPRPIPIFLLAVLVALALAGVGLYLHDLAPHAAPDEPTAPIIHSNAGGTPVVPAIPALKDAPVLVHSGQGSVWSCASCHGEAGEGAGITPRLAGMPEAYLLKQLEDFAQGTRLNESMQYVARGLKPDDMKELSTYYAKLPAPAINVPSSEANLARGEALFHKGDWKQNVPACISCHGSQGEGVGTSFPPLAAQQADYLFSQLSAWKGGHRHNSPQSLMDDIASRLSYEDLYAVSYYAASLPANGKQAK
ncbi:cytochrome c4 [Providencia rettgeri]|nr:cytochrome c4 [Providencia rettgeri]